MSEIRILQTARFGKQLRKLNREQKRQLDRKIREIAASPRIGVSKKGDLSGVFVHKFHLQKQLFLLAYTFTEKTLALLMLGPHENFYRDLKK